MPVWLLRFLPHIGIALALGFAIWWIYDSGADAAEAKAERRELTQAILIARMEKRLSSQITEGLANIDSNAAARLSSIDVTEKTVVMPTIQREIVREKRLSDPSAGLTPSLLDAINKARNASADNPQPAR
jgi:hypothetical protein